MADTPKLEEYLRTFRQLFELTRESLDIAESPTAGSVEAVFSAATIAGMC